MSNGNKPTPGRVPNVAPADRFDAADITIEGDAPLALDEIHERTNDGGAELERVTGVSASEEALKLEAFMHETVVIIIAEDSDEEALPVVTLCVNGTTQPIFRGVPTPVKRKYVEALARAKETKYRQSLSDPNDPASITMVPRTALAYPFSVESDPNPNGRAWLRELLKQPA
ncbi:hypothetical protein [Paraburkholderia youngii]|uniref:hypothetical protein n=1 Tax=Paraburkholderia youngii TaxID=2782701 RepID=UPI00158FD628|nr:hypothetical protein [Paraburkholderia youngii]NUX58655.1 hypothetical protein [Paraburkholderia youngii]